MEPFFGMSDNNINISDVIEVIQTTDPGFVDEDHCSSSINMLSGGGVERVRPVAVSTGSVSPFVEIIEQPASKALRFRYECEGRSAGSIPGINSTVENKTFPSIRIVGYKGRAVVVVSCVTKDQPYRPHPHNLVGKEGCKKGVCTVEVATENMTVTFANLGIQCVKKKDIEDALRVREEMRVDPFRTGFEHKKQPTSIDLNAVRLCFQVFLEGTEKGKFNVPLPSVVSDPIYDKKAMSDLVICKLSHCSASVAGGLEMILLCEKVAKEDIQVKFYEERDGQLVWEGYGDFQPSQVHKQVAIAFRTPTYRIQQVEQPVQVFIQLKRPSDGAISESLPFQMLPLGSGRPAFWSLRKAFARKKADYNTFNKILASEAMTTAPPPTTTTTMLSSELMSIHPRNIDEYNNNDIPEPGRKNTKITALRALNDFYNSRNNVETPNPLVSPKFMSNPIVDCPVKANVDFGNNAVDKGATSVKNSRGKDNEKFFEPSNDASSKNEIYFDNEIDRRSDCGNIPKVSSVLACKEMTMTATGKESQFDKTRTDWFDYSEVGKWVERSREECVAEGRVAGTSEEVDAEEEDSSKSLKELLTQVAELDDIYEDTHEKVIRASLEEGDRPMEIDVCDNQTYTSLQMALKNPMIELFDNPNDRKYEDVAMPRTELHRVPPIIPPPLVAKRDPTREPEERLPPLPPKRIRKMPSMPVLSRISSSQTCSHHDLRSSEAPEKHLPSLPGGDSSGGTLLKPSKQGIFSKLFAKKSKKDNRDTSSDIANSNGSFDAHRDGLTAQSKNNINENPSGYPRPSMTSVMSLRSFELNDDENPLYGMELTEAEHYALYTAMAPHATTSEFDEMSFYYSPVEGGKILTEAKQS
ncbi:embryonic polarity protein dorsal-like isoform X1 [Venturia canescens]|uniref:embryonic polarity protein dorsal-like isoform X1 n=1 Tax=Venturia canescens TaxID=32260 RepID=UPI001C9C991E|nr:embryonic polarity protein dorsal-like isoform X1 [Venturia canescens]XP_043274770.1 embryonic polarity protein dorsal-like isoform X1 [Venturia canescens]